MEDVLHGCAKCCVLQTAPETSLDFPRAVTANSFVTVHSVMDI